MSLRNLRKIYGGTTLPDPEGSEGDFDPHAKASTSRSKYQGLEIASASESEGETDKSDDTPEEPVPVDPGRKKKNNKKKKKKAKVAQGSSDVKSEDEVEKSLREVNKILGEVLAQPGPSTSGQSERDLASCMQVQTKHLNVTYETKRKFGKEVLPDQKKRGRQNPMIGLGKKCVVVPMDKYNFKKNGLSMSENRRVGTKVYFTYDHDKDYQRRQKDFLLVAWIGTQAEEMFMNHELEEAQANCHIELLLQCVDILFANDAHNQANTLLELTIAYLQYAASPKFDVTDMNTCLEYAYVENRPFHVAMLKYLYQLSNRACHRTALEVAKMLLNLDNTDPLAVLMIIDVIALRAREHAWLIDAIAKWDAERDATALYNIQYSLALAKYHISMKHKDNPKEATELLEKAMINFPSVVKYILDYSGQKIDPKLKEHPFFTTRVDMTTSKTLKQLTSLYAALVWEKWREQGIMEWFTETAKQLCDKYDGDIDDLKERTSNAEKRRMTLFSGYPVQVMRHINVIRPMSELIADGRVPELRSTVVNILSADPAPSTGNTPKSQVTINRYRYTAPAGASSAPAVQGADHPALEFLYSLWAGHTN